MVSKLMFCICCWYSPPSPENEYSSKKMPYRSGWTEWTGWEVSMDQVGPADAATIGGEMRGGWENRGGHREDGRCSRCGGRGRGDVAGTGSGSTSDVGGDKEEEEESTVNNEKEERGRGHPG